MHTGPFEIHTWPHQPPTDKSSRGLLISLYAIENNAKETISCKYICSIYVCVMVNIDHQLDRTCNHLWDEGLFWLGHLCTCPWEVIVVRLIDLRRSTSKEGGTGLWAGIWAAFRGDSYLNKDSTILCFRIADAMWPSASSFCWQDFPTTKDCSPKLWVRRDAFSWKLLLLGYFCHCYRQS